MLCTTVDANMMQPHLSADLTDSLWNCLCRRKWRMRQVFRKLDLNQSGTLEIEELAQLASNMLPCQPNQWQMTYFKCAADHHAIEHDSDMQKNIA